MPCGVEVAVADATGTGVSEGFLFTTAAVVGIGFTTLAVGRAYIHPARSKHIRESKKFFLMVSFFPDF